MSKEYRIYPAELEEFIKENPYIPRRIKFEEHLGLFHRYWSSFNSLYFKIQRIYYVNDIEYYSVKYPEKLFGEISYPLDPNYVYELMVDKNEIYEMNDIINTNISYSGAEIKYWFFSHKIDFSDPRFDGFWSFLDPKSQSVINDDKFYFVKFIDEDGSTQKCRISIDKNRRIKHV